MDPDGTAASSSVSAGSCASDGDGCAPRIRPRFDLKVWAFTGLLWAVGLALYFLVVRHLMPVQSPIEVSWWMLAIAFAATEIFVAHLKYRRDAQTYSLSEVPLLIGLCFATPVALVVGRMLGAFLALTLHRRQSGLKLAFNLGLFLVLDCCLAPLLFFGLLQDHLPLHPLGWAAAYVTIMVIDTLSGLAIAFVTLLHQGTMPASAVRRDLAFGIIVAAVNTSFGLVAVSTLWFNPPALALLLVVTAIMVLAYRGYVSLTAMYERLERLFAFTRSSGGAATSAAIATAGLEELGKAVKAGYVELTLFDQSDDRALRWVLDDEVQEALDPFTLQVSEHEFALLKETAIYAGDRTDLNCRPDLADRGTRSVMVAPLRDARRLAGSVLVGSRSRVAAFRQEDMATLQTLANHLAVTLKNARLVETLRAEVQEREHQALHDLLTDLPNRRAFVAEAEKVIAAAGAHDRFAVMLLDLADFRQINDTLGHDAGDRALIEVSRRFTDLPGVISAHLGGDEFAFLVPPPIDALTAGGIGARLRDVVTRPVALESFTAQLRAHVGIVLYPDHGETCEVLLQHADMTLQAAKATPQGMALFTPEHDTASPRRLALAHELEQALADGEIRVAYQPQVDLLSGEVVGVEALARWSHPRLGEVSPEEFIPIGESVGLIWELTQSVLTRSLAEVRGWLCRQEGARLSVNLSIHCLHYPELPDVLDEALRVAGIGRSQLVLELTESCLMTDFARFRSSVARLVDAGFSVSIDDFGVGYSSLAYIHALQLSEIKIDRAFVSQLLQSDQAMAIVKSVIDLSHAVGARAVAEGVEDGSTLRRLRDMGCDVGQGFFLSRPQSPEAFEVWLSENEGCTIDDWTTMRDRGAVVPFPRLASATET
jgi:diguanylate cyclase (GGDEF)-like protein